MTGEKAEWQEVPEICCRAIWTQSTLESYYGVPLSPEVDSRPHANSSPQFRDTDQFSIACVRIPMANILSMPFDMADTAPAMREEAGIFAETIEPTAAKLADHGGVSVNPRPAHYRVSARCLFG